ncbi:RNA polymerase sigma-70 factor (ECF subfamily) [Paraburkholderia bannensis]|uniref:RNA polymerase sigma-70 factor (ECF subfamily) n=1 Tax=Paraburkholderia bannensis TaxID=765414 RepID=A0A7W9TUQ4_9BURK|nr:MULTISPECIES: sigma-70 family RNA polymerase sigma factor [Paraburkholderia]MBB3255388.1 RNA polymerase sigma-70 factor (ECF subfamily) [Paraburkholderia sp. WP4_3_2]MBB6100600.1 RNA polymerase sigma-70 factor (ECF subfamily) [Paraburkholderia bannensis]
MTVIDDMHNQAPMQAPMQMQQQMQAQTLEPEQDAPAWDEARRALTFDKERARLLAMAARVLGSRAEAEDVVQDAWFRWRDADAAAVRTPQAWLATVTVRLAIDRLRKLRRDSAAADALAGDLTWYDGCAPSAEETGLRAAHLSEALLMLLERLGPLEQAVFVLREAFECDYAEIAALTGRTLAHCRQIVHRAHGRLSREVREVYESAPADAAQHARTVERLREVLHTQDRPGLLDLLGVTATAPAGCASSLPRPLGVEKLALARGGDLCAWLHVRERERDRNRNGDSGFMPVVCVDASSTLENANPAFGGAAVRALLAQYRQYTQHAASNEAALAVLA